MKYIGSEAFMECQALEKIYCFTEDPENPILNCYGSAVDFDTFSKATLCVPEVSVGKYRGMYPWYNFLNIVGFDPSGVEEITRDSELDLSIPYIIYNLGGMKVSESVENLSHGIYIIRQGNSVKKIVVK